MIIKFPSPVFYCSTYEDIFYQRISSLPAYLSIKLETGQFLLELTQNVDKESTLQLKDIFNYWNIDCSLLIDLTTG